MHPELELLEQRYRSLVEEVNAGHITPDDALVTLSGFVALDASGASWSVDPYTGQFTRAYPGAAPAPANPAEFVPASLPAPPQYAQPGAESWDAPVQVPMAREVSAGHPSPRGSAMSSLAGSASGLLKGRTRVIAISVAAVLAVLALFLLRPAPDEALPASESDGPSAEASPKPDASSEAPSREPSPDAASPSPSREASIPSKERSEEVLRTVTGGERTSFSEELAPDAVMTKVLLSAAPVTGAVRLGFSARVGEVRATGEGKAAMEIVVSNSFGPLEVYVVPLVRSQDAWLIEGPFTKKDE